MSIYIDRDIEDFDISGDITKLFIRGIFENPAEAMLMEDPTLDATNVDDEPYPLSGDMIQRITEGILSGELPMLKGEEEEQPE